MPSKPIDKLKKISLEQLQNLIAETISNATGETFKVTINNINFDCPTAEAKLTLEINKDYDPD